tara:strand:+ start:40 stop:282 length:243 start_codon:yes stop_codon:yes gene_type:complete
VEQLIKEAETELALIPLLVEQHVWEPYAGEMTAEEVYSDLKRRGIALQRHDIPMTPSLDYPTAENVELLDFVPPAPEETK